MPPQGKGQTLQNVLFNAPPVAPDVQLDQTPFRVTNPKAATLEDFLLGALGIRDPLAKDATPATGLGSLLGMVPIGAAIQQGRKALKAGGSTLQEALTPIRAYHGSPYDFDKFSLEKIGTGEGAQAYGHGLYFAESPEVANTYRGKVSAMQGEKVKIQGRPIDWDNPEEAAAFEVWRHDGNRERAAAFHERTFKGSEVPAILRSDRPLPKVDPAGKSYEVALHASPDDFLDWDKPLSQQSEKVRKALEKVDPDTYHPSGSDYDANEIGQQTYHRLWEANIKSGKAKPAIEKRIEVTDKLKKLGVKGIRYLDQGSRGMVGGVDKLGDSWFVKGSSTPYKTKELAEAASQAAGNRTSNYVVFDDAIIEIMKKYGVAFPVAAAMLQKAQADNQQKQGIIHR